MKRKIVLLVDNVHMGLGHEGLMTLAKKLNRGPLALDEEGLLMFLNRRRDKLKILGSQGKVVGYLKMPRGETILLDAIQFIPQTFGAEGFSYDSALKIAIRKQLAWRDVRKGIRTEPTEVYRDTRRSKPNQMRKSA